MFQTALTRYLLAALMTMATPMMPSVSSTMDLTPDTLEEKFVSTTMKTLLQLLMLLTNLP